MLVLYIDNIHILLLVNVKSDQLNVQGQTMLERIIFGIKVWFVCHKEL